jgi:outer membrane immunogenic protein
MKGKLLIGLLATFAASAAMAADLAVKAPMAGAASVQIYDWTGFYLGANGSYNWQSIGFPDPTVTQMHANGAMGGITVGADYQMDRVVAGILGDVDFGDVGVTVANGSVMTESANEKLFATIRGRIGFLVVPQLLLYGTAGVAFASLDQGENCPTGVTSTGSFCGPGMTRSGRINAGPYSLTGNALYVGGVWGGGAEWMFAPNWTTKVEYLYSNLGQASFNLGTAPSGVATSPRDVTLTQQQVRLGVNYRFSSH